MYLKTKRSIVILAMFILGTHKTKIGILVQESTEEKQGTTCVGEHLHEYPCHDSKTWNT